MQQEIEKVIENILNEIGVIDTWENFDIVIYTMTVGLSQKDTQRLLKIPESANKLEEYLLLNNYKSLHHKINNNRIVGEFTLGGKTYTVSHTGNDQYIDYALYRGIHLSISEIEQKFDFKIVNTQCSELYT